MADVTATARAQNGGLDDDRRAGAADRDDGAEHPRAPIARPGAAARGAGAHRLLRRRPCRASRADPGATDGFNLESIRRLLDTAGGSSAEVLNFSRTLRAPFEDEQPEILTEEEFAERWGPLDPRLIAHTEKLGLLRDLGDGRYRDSEPTLGGGGPGAGWSLAFPRAWRSTWSRRCGAARGGSRGCSSNSSLRTSGSRSTRRAGRRTTGRRCATPSSGCGRWRPRRCS